MEEDAKIFLMNSLNMPYLKLFDKNITTLPFENSISESEESEYPGNWKIEEKSGIT